MSTTEPQFNDPPRPFHQYPLLYFLVRGFAVGDANYVPEDDQQHAQKACVN